MEERWVGGIRVRAPEPCAARLSIIRFRAESEGPMDCITIEFPVSCRKQLEINKEISLRRRGRGRMTRVARIGSRRVWASVTDLAKEIQTNPTYIHARIKKGLPVDGDLYEKVY